MNHRNHAQPAPQQLVHNCPVCGEPTPETTRASGAAATAALFVCINRHLFDVFWRTT